MLDDDLNKKLDDALKKKAERAKEADQREKKLEDDHRRITSLMREFHDNTVNPALEEAKSVFEKRKLIVAIYPEPSTRNQVPPIRSMIEIHEPNTDFKYTVKTDLVDDEWSVSTWITFTDPKTNKREQKTRSLPRGFSKKDLVNDIIDAYREV